MQVTIGELLKSQRIVCGFTLEDISHKTNIAVYLLQALEENNFSKLPSSTFTKGFIQNYASVVGIPPEKALAVFRRDFEIDYLGKILPKGLSKPLDKRTIVTSKVLTILLISSCVFVFLSYLGYQLYTFQSLPTIQVNKPKPNVVVRGPIILVSGFVSLENTVYINDQIAELYPTGEFKGTVQLPSGDQVIKIKAVNKQGKQAQVDIPVIVVDN